MSNLDHLRVLKDGWLNGDGLAPSKEGLDWLERILVYHLQITPYIYPTYEGGVSLEWGERFTTDNTITINLTEKTACCHFWDGARDDWYAKNLDLKSEWDMFLLHRIIERLNWMQV